MARSPVVALAPGVWRVRLAGDWTNGFLLRDDDGQVTLVDTGFRRSADRIVAALAAIGSGTADVTRILLTHTHTDHAGSVAELARRTSRAVDVHAAEAENLRAGTAPALDATLRLGRLLSRLPAGRFAPAPVGARLDDGDVLPVAGGLRVVHTPGHSPGHVSLLHEPTRVLITGDALFNWGGVRWSVPWFCTDYRLSQHTAEVLGELDYDVAAFTHGPELREGARDRVRGFLARQRKVSA